MSLIKNAVESAVDQAMTEHPKYFTPQGQKSAKALIVRRVMAALRDGGEKPELDPAPEMLTAFAFFPADSREGRACANLRQLAGAVPPARLSDGTIAVARPANCVAVFALADVPPQELWRFTSSRSHIGAWGDFFAEKLPNVARRPLVEERGGEKGVFVPWPFPPSKEGKIYDWDAQ